MWILHSDGVLACGGGDRLRCNACENLWNTVRKANEIESSKNNTNLFQTMAHPKSIPTFNLVTSAVVPYLNSHPEKKIPITQRTIV